MEYFRSTHSQICHLLENHRPPTEHSTFSDKSRHVHRHTSPVTIISYGRISPPFAINPLGDKPAWRLIANHTSANYALKIVFSLYFCNASGNLITILRICSDRTSYAMPINLLRQCEGRRPFGDWVQINPQSV